MHTVRLSTRAISVECHSRCIILISFHSAASLRSCLTRENGAEKRKKKARKGRNGLLRETRVRPPLTSALHLRASGRFLRAFYRLKNKGGSHLSAAARWTKRRAGNCDGSQVARKGRLIDGHSSHRARDLTHLRGRLRFTPHTRAPEIKPARPPDLAPF